MLGAQTERVQIIKCCEVRCVIISISYLLLLFGGDILPANENADYVNKFTGN